MPLHHIPPEAIRQKRNDEAWIGFALANVPGAIVGYFIGKARLERESRDGKTLSDEVSSFNRGAFAGVGQGVLLGGILSGVMMAAGVLTNPFSLAGAASIGLGMLAPTVGGIVGFFRGGNSYNAAKQEELQTAVQRETARSRGPALQRAPLLGNEPGHAQASAPETASPEVASTAFRDKENQRMAQNEAQVAQGPPL